MDGVEATAATGDGTRAVPAEGGALTVMYQGLPTGETPPPRRPATRAGTDRR